MEGFGAFTFCTLYRSAVCLGAVLRAS
jgi:hypothetical protein